MKQELLQGLSDAQLAKLRKCKSSEEILILAKEEGVELTEEQLEAVSGGGVGAPVCPHCGTKEHVFKSYKEGQENKYVCKKCGAVVGDFGI